MPCTVRNALLAYSMQCGRQPAIGQSVRNEKPQETSDRQLRCSATPLLGCAVVVADDGPMPCSHEAYLKHLRSLARRGCFPDVRPFEAVLRHARESAASPRLPAVSHSGAQPGAAALRHRSIDRRRRAVMRFALRDVALQRLMRGHERRFRKSFYETLAGKSWVPPTSHPRTHAAQYIRRSHDTRTRALTRTHARTHAHIHTRTHPRTHAQAHACSGPPRRA